MAEVIIEDIIQQGLDRLPFQPWNDKPTVTGLLQSLLTPVQEVEDLLHQLNNERSIDVAAGKQLDMYGVLFDVARAGRLDEEYRSAIKGAIAGQLVSGTAPDIKNTSKFVTGASVCNIFEHFPGAAYVFVNKPVSYSAARAIEGSAMCGVRTRTSWADTDYFTPVSERGTYSNVVIDEDGNFILLDTVSGSYEMIVDIDNYITSVVPVLLSVNPLETLTVNTGAEEEDLVFGVLHATFVDSTSGFTSLVPGAVDYEVVDSRGKLVAPSSLSVDTLETGFIIDQDNNYIIDNYNNNIRYVTY